MSSGRRYPKTVYDLVDHDYVDRLPDKVDARTGINPRAFLARFDEEYYGASFDEDSLHATQEQRRELYRTKNHRNEDLYGRGLRDSGDVGAFLEAEGGQDPTPEYLGTQDYKTALAEFRAKLPQDGRESTHYTQELVDSSQKLRGIAGIKTSMGEGEGELIAMKQKAVKTKQDRLKEQLQIINNIGQVVTNHLFAGKDSFEVTEMLNWLHTVKLKFEAKLSALDSKGATLGK